MSTKSLADLQASVQDKTAFRQLADYEELAASYLAHLAAAQPTRIVSPSHHNYIFFQYPKSARHKITRPLNTDLLLADPRWSPTPSCANKSPISRLSSCATFGR